MTGPELRGSLIRIFGEGWYKKALEKLQVSQPTLHRQMNGTTPVSPQVAAHVKTLLETTAKEEKRKAANRDSVRAYKSKRKVADNG